MRKTVSLFLSIGLVFIGLTVGYASPVGFEEIKMNKETLRDGVVLAYTSQIGVRELTGQNDGKAVDMYLSSTGIKDNKAFRAKTGKGYAWCAAFVTWSFKRASKNSHFIIKTPESAWAPSWFPPSNTIYAKGKPMKEKPERADVVGIWSPKESRIGHVGFVDDWPDGDYVITVEGNTNTAGSREGDGVYRKRRLKANIYKVSRWI